MLARGLAALEPSPRSARRMASAPPLWRRSAASPVSSRSKGASITFAPPVPPAVMDPSLKALYETERPGLPVYGAPKTFPTPKFLNARNNGPHSRVEPLWARMSST
jgi:hypothetical protein